MAGRPSHLKNDGVKVSWDDDILNIWKNKSHVPNHQPDGILKCHYKNGNFMEPEKNHPTLYGTFLK